MNKEKLKQLHDRLEACPDGTVTRRDLRDLLAALLSGEEQPMDLRPRVGKDPLRAIQIFAVSTSQPAAEGPATDVDAAIDRVTRWHAGDHDYKSPQQEDRDLHIALAELARLRQQVIDADRQLRIAEDHRVAGLAQNNRLIAEVKRQGEEIARLRAEAKPEPAGAQVLWILKGPRCAYAYSNRETAAEERDRDERMYRVVLTEGLLDESPVKP